MTLRYWMTLYSQLISSRSETNLEPKRMISVSLYWSSVAVIPTTPSPEIELKGVWSWCCSQFDRNRSSFKSNKLFPSNSCDCTTPHGCRELCSSLSSSSKKRKCMLCLVSSCRRLGRKPIPVIGCPTPLVHTQLYLPQGLAKYLLHTWKYFQKYQQGVPAIVDTTLPTPVCNTSKYF